MNELTVYDRVQSPGEFIATMGRHIARSGMFGCETEDQGCVLALECAARRMPPLSLSQRYHLIKGKLSMKADAMLGGLIDVGGKYEVESHTPDLASITIKRDRKSQTFSLSWDDAKAEPFVYEGKEAEVVLKLAAGVKPKLKAKYATPRSRMQMLWARVVSDGCRVMAPDVVAGYYTPEETVDITPAAANVDPHPIIAEEHEDSDGVIDADESEGDGNGNGEQVEAVDCSPLTSSGQGPQELQPKPTAEQTAADAKTDVEIAAAKAKAAAGMAKAKVAEAKLTGAGIEGSAAAVDKPCHADQVDSVKAIYNDLLPRGFNGDALRAMMAELGAERVSGLSAGGCEQLIGMLMAVKEIFSLADELDMPADTLKTTVRKAKVEEPWQLPKNLADQLIAKLTKARDERAKN